MHVIDERVLLNFFLPLHGDDDGAVGKWNDWKFTNGGRLRHKKSMIYFFMHMQAAASASNEIN